MINPSDRAEVNSPPISSLFADAINQLSKLIRGEIALARAEMAEKSMAVARSSVMIAAGALLMIPSITILLMALGNWIMEAGLRASAAYLLAGLLGLVTAGVIAWLGVQRLQAGSLVPRRTLGQLQQDVQAAKEHL